MDINKAIAKAMKNNEECIGVTMEFSNNTIEEIRKYGIIKEISEYIANDDIRTYINSKESNNNMLLYVIRNMIEDGEIEIKYTDKATQKHINYINKLIGDE